MKFLHTILAAVALILACGTVTSCGGNDDDDDNDSSQVDNRMVGKWRSVVCEIWRWNQDNGQLASHTLDLSSTITRHYNIVNGVEDGSYTDKTHPEEWEELTFNSNGTYFNTNEDNEDTSGKWTASKNTLAIYEDGESIAYSYEFDSNGRLVLTEDEYRNGTLIFREKLFYEKQ